MSTFTEYKKKPSEVGRLRAMTNLWRKTNGFWTFDQTLDALSRPGALLVYASDEGEDMPWQAAAMCDIGPFDVDLLYVYVDPSKRGQGLARQLLVFVKELLVMRPNLEALHLEVRTSNEEAQSLYRKLGMEEVGIRKGYYSDGEDALTFRWSLKG